MNVAQWRWGARLIKGGEMLQILSGRLRLQQLITDHRHQTWPIKSSGRRCRKIFSKTFFWSFDPLLFSLNAKSNRSTQSRYFHTALFDRDVIMKLFVEWNKLFSTISFPIKVVKPSQHFYRSKVSRAVRWILVIFFKSESNVHAFGFRAIAKKKM